MYGANCSKQCDCKNAYGCDKLNGCSCLNGYTGSDCSIEYNSCESNK